MCPNYICQVEAVDFDSFMRTGKELGLQGLLENTLGAEVLRPIPVLENSKMFGDTKKEAFPTELNKERSIISNLKSGSDDGLSINKELPLDRNPEQDSKMVLDNTSEEALTKEAMNIELDKKPELAAMLDDKILKEFFDENLKKTNKKGKNAARDNERAERRAERRAVRAAKKAVKEGERLGKKERAADNKAERARRSELYREGKLIDSEVSTTIFDDSPPQQNVGIRSLKCWKM